MEETNVPEIVYAKNRVADLCGNKIRLHQDLQEPQWNTLREWLIRHEGKHIEHYSEQGSIKGLKWDVLHDLNDQTSMFLLFKFMWNRPSTWWQFWPFIRDKENKIVHVDYSHLIVYTLILFLGLGIFWVLKSYFLGGIL